MKNIIKKISATAMAFTLLGTGITVAKTINPKFDTAITASACDCKPSYSYTEWITTDESWQNMIHTAKWHTERKRRTSYCSTHNYTTQTWTNEYRLCLYYYTPIVHTYRGHSDWTYYYG